MDENTPKQANGTDSVASKKGGLSLGAITGLALAIGAAVGMGGVYVMGGFDGNGTMAASAPSGQCAAAQAAHSDLKSALTGDIAAMALRTQGEPIGDLSFTGADGAAVTLADTGPGYRLVNIWATWCAPCREEMPWLDALQSEKGDENFSVVAISVDGGAPEKPKAFYQEIGISNLTFYHDPTINVFNRLKREGLAFGLPVTLLVDENNCVIANMNGPAHWSGPDAYALADALSAR